MTTTNDVLCLCAICREDCVRGTELADFFVFERFNPSELNYIEIAHASCVRSYRKRSRVGPLRRSR